MRRIGTLLVVATVMLGSVLLAGCGGDSTESQAATDRYEKAKATQAKAIAIIADPQAFGSEEEVLAMLKEMAVPGLVSVDEGFGSVDWVAGWRYTLFSGRNAEIKTWRSWLSEDGSMGGSLWTWSGTAYNGKPFDLPGVEVSRYDENGLVSETVMFYPYEDEEVQRRFREGN